MIEDFNLNEEQKQAFIAVSDMVENKNYKMLSLDAPAGTGKSFLIKNCLIKKFKTALLAPTHKASEVLGNGATTIHKFFNSDRVIDELGNVSFEFKLKNKAKLSNLDLIIVDESSMVSKEMFKCFVDLSEIVPILFCGDMNQIPPIDEDLSEVFKIEKKITLTKNMRSKDSLSSHYVKSFKNFISERNMKVRVVREDIKDMVELFKKESDIVALAWTNKRVLFLNKTIRSYLFNVKEDELKKYYVGEKLIFSGFRNTNINKDEWDVEFYSALDVGIKYNSSCSVVIKNLSLVKLFIPFKKCSHQKPDNKRIQKCLECGINGRNILGYEIEFYLIVDCNGIPWYSVKNAEEGDKLNKILKDYKDYCFAVKNKKIWADYYSFQNLYKPNLSYSYSLTIHKSQGSQWENVIVDINNIRMCKDHNLSSRLSYTAVSRMSKMLYFI